MKNIRQIIRESLYKILNEENENVIQPNVSWMKQKYNEFNASIFGNMLPQCGLSVVNLPDNVLGRFTISKTALRNSMLSWGVAKIAVGDNYLPLNTRTFYGLMKPKISINAKFARNEKDMENTLIHEMCHYYTCFDENGDARQMDMENACHGADFQQACQLVAERTNNTVTIKQLTDAEKMDTMVATNSYNKSGMMVCSFERNGRQLFFYLKDMELAKDYQHIFKNIQYTTNPTLVMLMKRYKYQTTTARTFMSRNLMNAYEVASAPEIIQDTFNQSEWAEVPS